MCLHFLYNSKDIKSMMGNKSRETNSYCCLRPVGDDLGVQRIPLCQDHLFAAKFATICRARNKTFAIYISPDVHNCWTVSIINTRALNHSKALVASRNPSPVPTALQKDDGCQLPELMRPGLQGLKAIIPGGGPTQYHCSYGIFNVPSSNLPPL